MTKLFLFVLAFIFIKSAHADWQKVAELGKQGYEMTVTCYKPEYVLPYCEAEFFKGKFRFKGIGSTPDQAIQNAAQASNHNN